MSRVCTCHPDDNPPTPCAEQFALSECREKSTGRAVEAGPIGNKTTAHLNLTTPLQPIQKPSIAITRGKKK